MQIPSCRVASDDGQTIAEFVPDIGMVCCSLMHDGDELLDPGKGLDAYAAHGSTLGIPLLYPWANRLERPEFAVAGKSVVLPADAARVPRDPNDLAIHGVVPGLLRWLAEPRADEASLTARLHWSSAELLELFPYAHVVEIEVRAGDGTLTIATTVRASAGDPVPISFGFHPYLRLPGSSRDSWHLQLPGMDRLSVDERMIPTGERRPLEPGERERALADTSWDDSFVLHAQPARFSVTAGGRGIAVELLEGYPYAQIYAPPGRDFICFEPMTAPTNALRSGTGLAVLEPGGEYRAVFRVSTWGD